MNSIIFTSFVITLALSCSNAQFGGSVASNPRGGHDRTIQFGRGFGNERHNLGGAVFGSQNSLGGPPTFGGALNYNNNGHGLSYQHSRTPGEGSTDTFGGKVNVFDNGDHKVNINAFKSHTKLQKRQINSFDRYGGNIEYENRKGHGASIGIQQVPQFGHTSVDANAKVNLWKSNDRQTSFDWNTGVSKNIGQYNRGQTNFNTGVGLTHRL